MARSVPKRRKAISTPSSAMGMVSTLRTSASVSRRAMRPLRCGDDLLFETQELGAALLVQRELLFTRQPSDGQEHQVAGRLDVLLERGEALWPLGLEHPPDASRGFAYFFEKVHGFLTLSVNR